MPGVNGVITQLDDEPTSLGEYWHTIHTEHGERREPGCNLELIPTPIGMKEAEDAAQFKYGGPFMARRSTPEPKQPATLTPEQMRAGIDRLQKRLEELKEFDPQSVTEQYNVDRKTTV